MLSSENRLRLEKDIKTLFARGKSVFDASTGLKWRKNNLPVSRFAVAVGIKVSKSAVTRNRLRRQIRAALHDMLPDLAAGYDVMVLVRPEAARAKRGELIAHLTSALHKSPLLK